PARDRDHHAHREDGQYRGRQDLRARSWRGRPHPHGRNGGKRAVTPLPDNETAAGLLRDGAIGAVTTALAEQRQAIHQRILGGASGAEVMAALTQLVDRLIIGRYRFQDFQRRDLRRVVVRGADRYIERKIAERRREYEKFGETVYLLEPNVKKSKGGLRDLHVLQWAGMARYQAGTLQEFADRGILSRQDYQALLEAREFLWRVRALLHVHAGIAQEILTFDEQVRLAERFGFQD